MNVPKQHPFLNKVFFEILSESQCVGGDSGWSPHLFHQSDDSFSYLFSKNHSYGEYIFDWSWAQAFEQYGQLYYPKLTSMVPFTPATVDHFVGLNEQDRKDHMKEHWDLYVENNYSSLHYLFISREEEEVFKKENFIIRDSFQYHFFNEDYETFDDFLAHLKSRKAKQIKKERVIDDAIKIESLTGDELQEAHGLEMWNFYLSTIAYKGSIPYLNKAFFQGIFKRLKENILYVRAEKDDQAIAGSLFFFHDQCLYGRYWGCLKEVKNLHFELCYYRGIDFCLDRKIAKFEAGAQGEHKIARGFKPMLTKSAHHIKNNQFAHAIRDFTRRESDSIRDYCAEAAKSLPFKNKS